MRCDMSVLALERPTAGALRTVRVACGEFLAAVAQGVAAAQHYERLSLMSDGELRRLGIERQDIAWFALYGKPRPR
jgi:hypothetical protein